MRPLVSSLALSTTVAAVAAPNHFVVHENRQSEPLGWIRQERAGQSTILPVRIGLKQSNLDLLDGFVHDISDPDSPSFGAYPIMPCHLRLANEAGRETLGCPESCGNVFC